MSDSRPSDPAERYGFMRMCYRNWRPTRFGLFVNRLNCWWSGLGLPPRFQAALGVRGRKSGEIRWSPVVLTTVDDTVYLVSMLGPNSAWVRNVEAANGEAVIRQGRTRRVHLTPVPADLRASVLREYVRLAPGGRMHFPVGVGAPLAEFAAIANRYPVFRIDPA